MTYRIKSPIVVCFLLVWVVGIALRFINHDEHFVLLHHLARSSINFVLLFAIITAAFSLGERAFRYLKTHFSSPLETFAFSTSLGLGILSFFVFVLGYLHLLYRSVSYTLLAVLLAFSIPQIRTFLKKLQKNLINEATTLCHSTVVAQFIGPRASSQESKTAPAKAGVAATEKGEFKKNDGIQDGKGRFPFSVIFGAIFVISTCFYLIQAFTPSLNYDSLAYHLAIPKLYAENHRIFYIPHNVYANFPMTTEFLYLFSLLLYGDTLAKLVHFSTAILTVLAIYSFSVRHFNKKTALLASLIFYNIPFVGILSGWAFNDLMLTLYEFLAVAAILNWLLQTRKEKNRKDSWLHISAIFCGLAIGTKYPALLMLMPILLLTIIVKMFMDSRLRGNDKKSGNDREQGSVNFLFLCFKKSGLFILITLLVVSPWLIKNIFYTHNPVYPFFHDFFYKFFGHPSGEVFDTVRFMQHHQPQNTGFGHILSLLWEINMDKRIGAIFILFLPIIIFIRSVKPAVKLILAYGSIYFLLWAFFTHQDIRFLIPFLPAMSIASAYAVNSFSQNKKLTLFIYAVIVFVFLFNLSWLPLTVGRYGLLKVVTGIKNRDEFLIDSPLYQYPAFHYINNELPQDAKILLIGENQTYYCSREVVSNSPLDTNIIVEIVNESSLEKDISARLSSSNITHILLNSSEVKRVARDYRSFNLSEDKSRLLADFLTSGRYLREIFYEKGVFVYELIYE